MKALSSRTFSPISLLRRSAAPKKQPLVSGKSCRQQAVLAIKKKYGKNAILKGMDLEEGATARDRNGQIGGHKA